MIDLNKTETLLHRAIVEAKEVADITNAGAIPEALNAALALVDEHRNLIERACAYIDRTCNSARDSTRERDALIACLPPLGRMVWSDELRHYVRLPVEVGGG